MPSVSVVICAHADERWDRLVAAVESVRAGTAQPREIVVVVDHNERLLRRVWTLPSVIAVANTGAPGLASARNRGVGVARGEIVAFMDDDATAEPDWLERLIEPYDDQRVLGVGGAIVPQWPHARPAWFPPEFDWVVGCTFDGMPRTPGPVRALIGCNMSLRRGVWEAAGGFHEDLGRIGYRPVAGEETEFCIRAAQLFPDSYWWYLPQARVRHHIAPSRTRWRYFRSRSFAEGLSKARIVGLVGRGDGLAAERTYTTRVLPAAVVRNLVGRRGDGIARAGAVVAGLGLTAAGYGAGRLWSITGYEHRPGLPRLLPLARRR